MLDHIVLTYIYQILKSDGVVDATQVFKKNNADSTADVIKRYEEWHQSLAERQNRTMRGKIPHKHIWTNEEIERFKWVENVIIRTNCRCTRISFTIYNSVEAVVIIPYTYDFCTKLKYVTEKRTESILETTQSWPRSWVSDSIIYNNSKEGRFTH